MVAPALLETVFALPVADRIDLLRQLENNLRSDPDASPLTASHRRILDVRLADFEADPTAGSPWENVKRRIESALDGV